MNRTTYGLVAGLIAASVGVWLWRRRAAVSAFDPRGTVILDNTPVATDSTAF